LSEIGNSLAQQAGPPASLEVQPLTERDRIKAWNEPHPKATDEAMMQLAVQKYQEHRQKGLPDADARRATAEDLTHFRYRARMALYTQGTTEWTEQVKEAQRLSKLAGKVAEEQPSTTTTTAPGLPALPALGAAPQAAPSTAPPTELPTETLPEGGLTSGY
jgi:hypothetical protein